MIEAIRGSQEVDIEDVENSRDHLALRFEWAQAVAKMRGEPLSEALARDTDIYARIFGKREPSPDNVKADPRWQQFVLRLELGEDPISLSIETRLKVRSESEKKQREFFGPFRYDYDRESGEIHIHFGSMGWSKADRDAPPNFASDIKSALRSMFADIKQKHPQAIKVSSGSWLLSRALASEPLGRLMAEVLPAPFLDSRHDPEFAARGGGRWGQFVDNRGKVHAKRAEEFRKRMRDPKIMTPKTYLNAFPLQPTALEASIEDFYAFYGIE